MRREFSRDELERARRECGCRADLDTALADPLLAICIQNQAEALAMAAPPPTAIRKQLRRLARFAGRVDWRARAANDDT